MKQIKQYIKESILDDEDDIIQNDDIIIEQWLKDNYRIKGKYIIKDNIIDIKGNIIVENPNIEELLPIGYKFGVVKGDFDCYGCKKLKTLKGSPKEVTGIFNCAGCNSLITLEGAPEIIHSSFNCTGCKNLISLKGCPEKVPGNFYCTGCIKLKTLDNIAKNIEYDLYCFNCEKIFEKSYITKKTNIGGKIVNK